MSAVAPGFEPVRETLEGYAEADPTYSAQLAVYRRAELVVDLTVGPGLQPDSLLPVYSSSKGATAMVISLLVQRGQLALDATVASYWPEFAANGKHEVKVRQLLSHQAGLNGVDGGFTWEEAMAHEPLAVKLAAQRPFWQPGRAYMYHALTIGTLAEELCRRVDGRPVGQVLREDVTGPRDIDVWLGTPESEDHRVADAQLPTGEEVMAALADMALAQETDGIGSESLPRGNLLDLPTLVNSVEFRRAGQPAAALLASARGLAKLYAATRHDVGAPRLLTDDTIAQMSQIQSAGMELGTGLEARFGVMFQVPCPPRWSFGSFRAFGHDGAGGSLAFCDPTYDLGFGYTVQRMPLPGGMDQRAVELSKVVRRCVS
jgi:CubicO group peptidase (beta-lactamase class C family)